MSMKTALLLGLLIPVGFAATLPANAMGPGGQGRATRYAYRRGWNILPPSGG